jgi:glycogen synthase
MNVLMLGWEISPHITGGLGVACDGLLHGLHSVGSTSVTFVLPKLCGKENSAIATFIAAHSYARTAFCTEGDLAALSEELVNSRQVCNISAGKKITPPHTLAATLSAYRANREISLAPIFDYAARMPDLMKNTICDVIHAHDWLTLPAAVVAKQHSNRPFVAHIHSTEVERTGKHVNPDVFAIEFEGLKLADKVIAVSHLTRQVLVTHYNVDPRKVDVIYNAADHFPCEPPRLRTSDNEPVVLFIGRITHQKGPRYFIEAASLVLRRFEHAHFIMAGDGDLLPMVKSLVRLKGLQDHFHFPGFLDAPAVRSLLTRADIYVMPSVAEPFGIGALEAIRAGVPVVVSQQSGVTEVIDHLSCVEASDTHALAGAITDLLACPVLAYQQALHAQQQEAQLSWSRSAETLLLIYEAAIGSVSPPTSAPLSLVTDGQQNAKLNDIES